MKYLFGPVPSRRLGLSLGVDILPAKTCNMNCVYCEIGPGKKTYSQAPSSPEPREILKEIKEFSATSKRRFDCLTFTASGEPTLHRDLALLIKEGKRITGKPVTVLTNSSTVARKDIRETLCLADVVLPSLDAATPETFRKINRPHPDIKITSIIEGLSRLRKEMDGQMWLEILFVNGINDTEKELLALREATGIIAPHRIQLNTVVRPPAEKWAKPVTKKRMEEIRTFFGEKAEIVIDFNAQVESGCQLILESEILDTLRRRPLTLQDINGLFGRYEQIKKILLRLLKEGDIEERRVQGRVFYAVPNPLIHH